MEKTEIGSPKCS